MTARANLVPLPPSGLVIALQFWGGDKAEALRLARLIADIEPERRGDVTLAFCRRFDVELDSEIWETSLYCGHKFGVSHLRSEREATGHPDGSFGLWAGVLDQLSAAWIGGTLNRHSVFLCEADGVPLRADWIDRIKSEHERTLDAGKRITGPEMNRGVRHLNGTLAMALSCWIDRPSLRRCPPSQAWDLFHAAAILAEGRGTGWMKNVYGAGNWSPESLAAMAMETAWLSSSKDTSAIAWAERTLVAPAAPAAPANPGPDGRISVHG